MKRSNAKEYREVTPVSTGIWIDALRGKVVAPRKDKENDPQNDHRLICI